MFFIVFQQCYEKISIVQIVVNVLLKPLTKLFNSSLADVTCMDYHMLHYLCCDE